MYRSPFKWVGGKSKLRSRIISIMPPHDCYVEVFGGAAWVLFGKKPSRVEILNDIDCEVINFFRVIQNQPQAFLDSFEWNLVSRDEFQKLSKLCPSELDAISRAHRFYYLIMASWGGEFGSPRFQTSIHDDGHGNRLVGALKNLEQRIMPAYERLRTVIIENLDWSDCIDLYDNQDTLMYLDPPYPGNNCNYPNNMRSLDEHEELIRRIRSLKAKFILTTYDLPDLRSLLSGFNIISVEFPAGMQGRIGRKNKEIIISNFEVQNVFKIRNDNVLL